MVSVGVAGNKDTTGLLMDYLVKDDWPVRYLITLKPDHPDVERISGYQPYTEWNIPEHIRVYHPGRYSLDSEQERQELGRWSCDILLVVGWQRLIPDWLLHGLKIGAFGMHGSSEPLPGGRGRSPLNWSIIQGKPRFITNLFRYRPGIDDGDIVASHSFDITDRDTGASLQLKNTLAMIRLLKEVKHNLLNDTIPLVSQFPIEPTYYPKRRPEDGEILWALEAVEIHRLVRAVTRPFPGAFSYLDGIKVTIWAGEPLSDDTGIETETRVGEIVAVLSDGSFIAGTGDGLYRVLEYEAEKDLKPRKGKTFSSRTTYCWDWRKLPMSSSRYCSTYTDIPEGYRYYPPGDR